MELFLSHLIPNPSPKEKGKQGFPKPILFGISLALMNTNDHLNSNSQYICVMRKIYYLSTCDTCKRIIKQLALKEKGFVFQDIKTEKITGQQLDEMAEMSASYEALFSRVAQKYKLLGLDKLSLKETDYKNYILEEYTFLKRPVIIIDGQIFIGNSKANIESVSLVLSLV